VIILTLVLLSACAPCCESQDLGRAVSVTDENDYFDFWRPPDQRPDDNYTQGLRVHADISGMPAFLRKRFCPKQIACGSSLEIGQEMYTPTEDGPGQRPYAGWLYTRGSASAASADTRRTFTATVGLTGPASLAAQTQDAFHNLIPGFRHPVGWDQQLPTELAFALQVETDRYLSASVRSDRWVDLSPEAHATVGTLRTALGAGGRARLGHGLSHPWLQEPGRPALEAYLLFGAQAEAVGRDLFLDGSTFQHSVHVAHEPVVGEWERGAGLRYSHLGVEYRAVTSSREYPSGPASHTFGGVTVMWWITH
jgi:hypothetical protein